jgi:hypothetical protein
MRSRRKFIDRLAVFKINDMVLLQPNRGYVFTDSTRLLPANNTDFVGGLIATTGSNYATQATAANKPQLKSTVAGNNYLDADGLNDALNFNTPIPNGAWFADMQNIDYLKNSNPATNNTIVDYLGNTITLRAGEIGWNSARNVRNILSTSEFVNGLTGITFSGQVSATSLSGFGGALQFSTQTQTSFAYVTYSIDSNREYIFSAFVQMTDGLPPAPGGVTLTNSTDFRVIIGGQFAEYIGMQKLINSVYRVFYRKISAQTLSNVGIIKYTTNSARAFKVSGYCLVDVTGLSGNDVLTEYLSVHKIYNSGLDGDKFFDTNSAHSLSATVVTEATGAKLPTIPTIKVNAGDNISVAGDLYAMAYGPMIPSNDDRLKIEKYVQDAKL